MQYPSYDPHFVYDPNHPMNIEDRANDPDDGIDYDAIILATEADARAGRGAYVDDIRRNHRLDQWDLSKGSPGTRPWWSNASCRFLNWSNSRALHRTRSFISSRLPPPEGFLTRLIHHRHEKV